MYEQTRVRIFLNPTSKKKKMYFVAVFIYSHILLHTGEDINTPVYIIVRSILASIWRWWPTTVNACFEQIQPNLQKAAGSIPTFCVVRGWFLHVSHVFGFFKSFVCSSDQSYHVATATPPSPFLAMATCVANCELLPAFPMLAFAGVCVEGFPFPFPVKKRLHTVTVNMN